MPALRAPPLSLTALDSAARTWLRTNTRLLRVASDTLRAAALLSPAADAELRAEAASALISLLTIYRDCTEYIPTRLPRSTLVLLQSLKSLQLLLEMRAVRRAPLHSRTTFQLRLITIIEAVKAALRLSLLARLAPKGRTLTALHQTLPPAPQLAVCSCGMAQLSGVQHVVLRKGQRSGRKILKVRPKRERPQNQHHPHSISTVPSVPSDLRQLNITSDPILDALFMIAYERRANWVVRMFMPDCDACSDAASPEAPPPPRPRLRENLEGIQRVVSSLKPEELAAEVLYIARPVVHLMLIRRFGWTSWRAWAAALLLDAASRIYMAPPADDSDVEERRRRMAELLLYLGRTPLFDFLMRRFVKSLTSPLRRIPVVGGMASSAIDWATLLQQYWFYTSGS